jgi:hypothetical protein
MSAERESRWPMSPRERYQNDPVFHQLVDLLLSMLYENDSKLWTPTELREAVMLAAMMYEQTHIRPLMIDKRGEYIK